MVKRLLVLKVIIIIVFVLLGARAAQLQLFMGDYYHQLSEGNRISLRPINAPRGKIMDQQGEILATNRLSYSLYLLPNEIPPDRSIDRLLEEVARITSLDLETLQQNFERHRQDVTAQSAVLLKRHLSSEDMVIIEENNHTFPGVMVKESPMREYVHNGYASHILGYLGEINTSELEKFKEKGQQKYTARDIIGKSGLEKTYEQQLKGRDGVKQIEVNNLGQEVRVLGTKPPEPGKNLILNLDFKLQKKIEDMLAREFQELAKMAEEDEELDPPTGAAAIALKPGTGAVLSLASFPTFDLNKFARGFSGDEYQELANAPLNPLLNRPLRAVVPPGSVFKLVTGTAAIKYLGIDGNTEFEDKNGTFKIPNWSRPYRNWHYGGEGTLDFTRAIGRSNNIVFYKLGYRLYKKYKGSRLVEMAREYGLGSRTGIDLPGEKDGRVPDGDWKQEKYDQGWYPGDSVNLSIGQGGLQTTPIQIINMVSAIANKGVIYRPSLVDKVLDDQGEVIVDKQPVVKKRLDVDKEAFEILTSGMTEVTHESYGTAGDVFMDYPIKIAGKTGTAQSGSGGYNHGWFVGFAPASDPEIAVLVFLENGNSSSHTLPIAREIFNFYFKVDREAEDDGAGE